MMITKLLAVASLASAVVVREAAILRAELARGAPSIELAADINLGGEELTVSAPCERRWCLRARRGGRQSD